MDLLGLPLHPLIVHAAVIFVPVAALAALLLVFAGRLRERYGSLVVVLAAVATLSAFAAMLTGPALAQDLGLGPATIGRHAFFGQWTPWPTLALAVAFPLFLRATRSGGMASMLLAGVTVVAALAALVLVALTGHAGATAVWG